MKKYEELCRVRLCTGAAISESKSQNCNVDVTRGNRPWLLHSRILICRLSPPIVRENLLAEGDGKPNYRRKPQGVGRWRSLFAFGKTTPVSPTSIIGEYHLDHWWSDGPTHRDRRTRFCTWDPMLLLRRDLPRSGVELMRIVVFSKSTVAFRAVEINIFHKDTIFYISNRKKYILKKWGLNFHFSIFSILFMHWGWSFYVVQSITSSAQNLFL